MATRVPQGTAALDKALDVLDAVGASPQGLSQAELAARLALPRTTLYRMLATLVARGLLRRDPHRRIYRIGFRCFEYARAAHAMPDLVAAAGAELRSLRDLTGETTYLAVLDGLEVLSLERIAGAHPLRSQAMPGQRKPLHCTSQGKAILAALDPVRRNALVREIALPALTPHTITDRRRLHAELKATAARGYSIEDEEIAEGVRCCGAAIVDPGGAVRGAISVAAPAFRLTRERVELLGPELAQAARRIGAQLGANTPPPADGEARAVEGQWAFRGAFPRWSAADRRLYWADVLGPSVQLCEADVDRRLAGVGARIDAMLLRTHGVAVRCGERWWQVAEDGSVQPLPIAATQPARAFCAHPDGSLWACIADGERWRIAAMADPGRRARRSWRVPDPAEALVWSADGATLYAAMPDSGSLYAMREDSSAVRRLATVPKGSGRLAGLAVDSAGGVWSALQDGWSVVRFGVDGTLDRVLPVPVSSPTDLAFGGADLCSLYITTSREPGLREALGSAPLSGRLFCARLDTPGAPTPLWREGPAPD